MKKLLYALMILGLAVGLSVSSFAEETSDDAEDVTLIEEVAEEEATEETTEEATEETTEEATEETTEETTEEVEEETTEEVADEETAEEVEEETAEEVEEETTEEVEETEEVVLVDTTAKATTNTVLVDGEEVAFEAYNIADNNYFKLRDVATVLSGTAAQFEVTWDGELKAIDLITGEAYTEVGGELAEGDGTEKTALVCTATIYLNGEVVELTAYTINNNNFFKLRDLGEAMDFNVSWDGTQILVDSETGYTAD